MRSKMRWAIILGILVLAIALASGASSAQSQPPATGNWTVDEDTTLNEKSIRIQKGNIKVNSDATLILNNCSLISDGGLRIEDGGAFIANNSYLMIRGSIKIKNGTDMTLIRSHLEINTPIPNPHGIVIDPGSTFTARDADGDPSTRGDWSSINSFSTGARYWIQALPGSHLNLQGVNISDVGMVDPPDIDAEKFMGIHVDDADLDIHGMDLLETKWGILIVNGARALIRNLSLYDIDYHGIWIDYAPDVHIHNLFAPDRSSVVTVSLFESDNSVICSPNITSKQDSIYVENSTGVRISNGSFPDTEYHIKVLRSDITLVDFKPVPGSLTVLVDSLVLVESSIKTRVLRKKQTSDDPIQGAFVQYTWTLLGEKQTIFDFTDQDGATDFLHVPSNYYRLTQKKHDIKIDRFLKTDRWENEKQFDHNGTGTYTYYEGEGSPYDLNATSQLELFQVLDGNITINFEVYDIIGNPSNSGKVNLVIQGSQDFSFTETGIALAVHSQVQNGIISFRVWLPEDPDFCYIRAITPYDDLVVTLTAVQLKPVLHADAEITTKDDLVLDASSSKGDGLQYQFWFGDGTTSGWSDEPEMKHAYGKTGTYKVKLAVRDTNGLVQETSTEVKVVEPVEEELDIWIMISLIVIILGTITILYSAYQYRRIKQGGKVESEDGTIPHLDKTRMAVKWFDRGTLMAGQNINEAVTCLEKSLQLNPGFSRAYYNLGVLLMSRNNLAGAREMFIKARENDPDFPKIDRAINAIERIEIEGAELEIKGRSKTKRIAK